MVLDLQGKVSMKRYLDDNALRNLVSARRRKGSAFLSDKIRGCTYEEERQRVDAELANLSREEILKQFSAYTYDMKE